MNKTIHLKHCRHWLGLGVMVFIISVGTVDKQCLSAENEHSADDGRGILRYDPFSETFVPISKKELKVGHVYSHFSKRLNRRVWSYFQSNGNFWHALGETTTLEAWRIDIRATREKGLQKLWKLKPKIAEEWERYGPFVVFIRLNSQNEWKIFEATDLPSIFDVETGYRWEKHSNRFIRVSHSSGYCWAVHSGKFLPAQ